MRLPSIEAIISGARRAVARFPLALLSAVVGTITLIIAVENDLWWISENYVKIIMTASLGLPLFVTLTCLAEKRN